MAECLVCTNLFLSNLFACTKVKHAQLLCATVGHVELVAEAIACTTNTFVIVSNVLYGQFCNFFYFEIALSIY